MLGREGLEATSFDGSLTDRIYQIILLEFRR